MHYNKVIQKKIQNYSMYHRGQRKVRQYVTVDTSKTPHFEFWKCLQ
jgi:hypothetical protein